MPHKVVDKVGESASQRVGKTRERAISAEFSAVNEKERTAELSFSSEQPVEMYYGTEILCHDAESVDMSRLQEIGVLLFNHDRDYVLGPVLTAAIDVNERKGVAKVRFDRDEDSEKIFQKVLNQTLRGVSVRYSVDVIEEVKAGAMSSNGRFAGPVDVVTRWTPYEISIVSIPADASVGVGRSDDAGNTPHPNPLPQGAREQEVTPPSNEGVDNAERSGLEDPDDIKNAGRREVNMPVDEVVDVVKERQAAIDAERTRASDITVLCREFEMDPAEHIASGRSIDEVRKAVLDELSQRNKPLSGAPRVDVVADAVDKFRGAASHALLLRAGLDPIKGGAEKVDPAANELRGMSIKGMMEEYLRMMGNPYASRMAVEELMRSALTPDSQFLSILNATVNASMLIGHAAADTTYQLFTKIGNNTDFKATPKFRASEASVPKLVGQNGEIESATMSDEKVTTQIGTYAETWGLTRQAIIDDKLNVLTEMPAAYARACRRLKNQMVYALFNSNAAIYDGYPLFSAAYHSNDAAVAGPPGVDTLGAARAAMMKHKDVSGVASLNIKPRYLIVGIDIQTAAEQLILSASDPAGNNSAVINPFSNKLQVVSDGDLADTNSWISAADPNVFDTIELSTLNGKDVPTIDSRTGFNVLGVEWRIYDDFGVTAVDYRGLHRNTG